MISNNNITDIGREFYNSLFSSPVDVKEKIKQKVAEKVKESEDLFEKFWEEFPRTATFEFKEKHFQGDRALRTGKKSEMKAKFNSILSKGEYTGQQIIDALKYEVYQKKEQSFKTGQNKLTFLNAMPAWLNQEIFASFIGMKIPEEKPKEFEI